MLPLVTTREQHLNPRVSNVLTCMLNEGKWKCDAVLLHVVGEIATPKEDVVGHQTARLGSHGAVEDVSVETHHRRERNAAPQIGRHQMAVRGVERADGISD